MEKKVKDGGEYRNLQGWRFPQKGKGIECVLIWMLNSQRIYYRKTS
ncbi:hypothetical protein E2C01_047801 [Portunus trituberculatus]|uniref:Uncharacterized protein n=1 Tax=Portunus trituberculatus TaxID=210409 RepID=A0A5B7G9T8_PORTR|nr:hypothetical protein [Portunus trituberculatus]